MFKSKEEKVAVIIAKKIAEELNCECVLVEHRGNNFLYVYNEKINILMTVCNTNKKKVIKIEEILIDSKYRNKGVGTMILKIMKIAALENNITLGLWCELNNKKLFNFYSILCFKYIETLEDDWLEFN